MVMLRLRSGFAVIGDTQQLPGYSLLLIRHRGVDHLTDLRWSERVEFLSDLALLGEAVETACRPFGLRRMNYEVLGNSLGFLHGHVHARYEWEAADRVEWPVWGYPDRFDPQHAYDPERHGDLRESITRHVRRLSEQHSGEDRGQRPIILRTGSVEDAPAVLALFDEAIEWLVARGQPEQWGAKPWSTQPDAIARVQALTQGEIWLAESRREPVGALVVSSTAPSYVSPTPEPELYVELMLTSRGHQGEGIGAVLLQHAESLARQRGLNVLRVDCFAGAAQLVSWYEQQGFSRTETFSMRGWPGQVLARRL